MNKDDIINFLAKKWNESGVEKGDKLLVHSSLKKLLKKINTEHSVNVSPEIVYDSLIKSLGKGGTLILPLFNFDFPKTKFFDINKTPSQMGVLTEVARNHPKSICSKSTKIY